MLELLMTIVELNDKMYNELKNDVSEEWLEWLF